MNVLVLDRHSKSQSLVRQITEITWAHSILGLVSKLNEANLVMKNDPHLSMVVGFEPTSVSTSTDNRFSWARLS